MAMPIKSKNALSLSRRSRISLLSERRSSGRYRERSRSHSRLHWSTSDDSGDSDCNRSRKKRKITEAEIAEYVAKKAQRKAMKAAKKLKAKPISGYYSNDSNPFGDLNLNEKFVWRKKIERDVAQGVPLDMLFSVKVEKKKQRERMAEIEKVKKRREGRALEKAQYEEQMAMLARERARAEFQDWEKREEEFHFHQSKMRSEIRIHQGRMKPIDILSKYLNVSDAEIDESYLVFKGLTVRRIEELRDDIKMYLNLDRKTQTHIDYWEAFLVVCNWELAEALKRHALHGARVRGEQPPPELIADERGLHSSIEADVKDLLEGKTWIELEALRSQIELQMSLGTAKLVEYWEAILKRLQIYRAKARLKEIHGKMLRNHLQCLQPPSKGGDVQTFCLEPVSREKTHDAEEAGSFSPQLLYGDENESAIDPEEDTAMLERKRKTVVLEQRRIQEAAMASKSPLPEENLELKAMKAMDDEVFGSGAEVNVNSSQGWCNWWHDKYRPRKPKYFNRVHTGYEWNKYNRIHYDHDNPPPKAVQGYKFDIFYPDLIDKGKVPTYTTEKDGCNVETCIIRFHAGPPYEDIAFKIVNNEWEKKGLKCTFERGILHLHFNFKRDRYRR